MLLVLAILFVAVPIVELYVIIQVGHAIGLLDTIAVMVLVPADEMLDGALVLAGGVLLLTPGFVSDGVGILLLFPTSRSMVRAYLRRRLRMRAEIVGRGRP